MEMTIEGKRVQLRPLTREDLPTRACWTADDELAHMMGVDTAAEPFVSPEEELRGNHEWFAQRLRANALLYAIEVQGRYIGDIDLTIDPKAHEAVLSVFIGERSQWDKGYGTESLQLLLNSLASDGRARVVLATTVAKCNPRAHHFWQKLGFQPQEEAGKATTYALRLSEPSG